MIQLDRPVQYEKFEAFQEKIEQVTDQYEHFGARFLRLYNKNKRLDFAVDLAKLDQQGYINKYLLIINIYLIQSFIFGNPLCAK